MKNFLKNWLTDILGFLTRRVFKNSEMIVIGVTGSTGKTSTKDAIYAVISHKFKAGKSFGNLNSDLGIPLTVAGIDAAEWNASFWLKTLGRLLMKNIKREGLPYDIMVLEMGADKPGDIKRLVEMVRPDVGVVTNVSASHLEFFGRISQTVKEKRQIVEDLDEDGFAILCGDDERVAAMAKKTEAQILTFGLLESNLVRATNIGFNWRSTVQGNIEWGMSFKLNYNDNVVPVRIKNALGIQQVYATLAAAAVGISLGMNLIEIADALLNYEAYKGRMRVIEGINGSVILDDSYNASSPASILAALDVLEKVDGRRKVAVLADMLELGASKEKAHLEVGKMAAEVADVVLTFGELSRIVHEEVKRAKKKATIAEHFETQGELVNYLRDLLKEKVVVLVKGSQGMRMERVVEGIMRYPKMADQLLVRQSKEWKSKR